MIHSCFVFLGKDSQGFCNRISAGFGELSVFPEIPNYIIVTTTAAFDWSYWCSRLVLQPVCDFPDGKLFLAVGCSRNPNKNTSAITPTALYHGPEREKNRSIKNKPSIIKSALFNIRCCQCDMTAQYSQEPRSKTSENLQLSKTLKVHLHSSRRVWSGLTFPQLLLDT